VSGKVSFTATVSNATPTRVDFTIDGGGTFSEYQSPYVYNGDGNTLDTTTLTNGTHTLAARAYFSDGTSVAANEQVNVQNASTTPTPTVTIASPTAGATVSGNVSFTATVANGTPTRVDFTIDGGGTFSESQSPYVYNGDGNTLDTTTLTNGTHTLAARAYFSDGSNVATSEQVNVQNAVLSSQTTPNVTGNSVMRFGTSYGWSSGYNRYDSIFVGYGDVDAAAALTARSLVYKGGVDVTDTTNTDPGLNISGVPYKQALANGWLLKDSSGNLIRPANGANTWFGDVGNSAYQKAWADNVSNFLTAHGADGVFIDNVLCSFGGLSNGVLPAQYPTDTSWATAQAAFLAYVGPALKAKGLYVAVNGYCYGPDDGSANTAWWTRIAPYVDGLMTEDFEQNPGNLAQLFFNSPTTSWMGNWLGKLEVIKAAQSAGKAAYALSYGAGSNTALMTYTKASYLMVWNGKGGGYIFNPLDSTDPWNLAWTAPVGQPNGAMTQVGGAYVRDFTTGYVVVNPSTGSVTVPLPTGLKTISGAAAGSSVTLATTTAAIFLKYALRSGMCAPRSRRPRRTRPMPSALIRYGRSPVRAGDVRDPARRDSARGGARRFVVPDDGVLRQRRPGDEDAADDCSAERRHRPHAPRRHVQAQCALRRLQLPRRRLLGRRRSCQEATEGARLQGRSRRHVVTEP
jgi:hypothetical protein